MSKFSGLHPYNHLEIFKENNMVKKPIKKMTKAELLEELKGRPAENVTIKDCHLESNIIFDSRTINLMEDIAEAVHSGMLTLHSLTESISSSRVQREAMIQVGTEITDK